MWNLKKIGMDNLIYKAEIEIQVQCKRDRKRRINQEIGTDIHKLLGLCIKYIVYTICKVHGLYNENLLLQHREFYSIFCDDLNGKEVQKKGIYVYIQLIHFAVQQKLTQYCKAAILFFFKRQKAGMLYQKKISKWSTSTHQCSISGKC